LKGELEVMNMEANRLNPKGNSLFAEVLLTIVYGMSVADLILLACVHFPAF